MVNILRKFLNLFKHELVIIKIPIPSRELDHSPVHHEVRDYAKWIKDHRESEGRFDNIFWSRQVEPGNTKPYVEFLRNKNITDDPHIRYSCSTIINKTSSTLEKEY